MYNIVFYIQPDGEVPLKIHLDSLELKLRNKVLISIELLGKKGNMLGEPYTKFLKDGIYELRTRQGNTRQRILFFFSTDKKIVLTHGFTKTTRKVPQREIIKAKRYRADYLRR